MKTKIIIGCVGVCLAILLSLTLTMCTTCTTHTTDETKVVPPQKRPLNITVYLDLSDRLVRPMTPSQKERDLAIVGHLLKCFKDSCIKDKILSTKNRIKVVFYPAPSDAEIAARANQLEIDMTSLKGTDRKKALMDADQQFMDNLAHIYDETISEKRWLGSDIWDFFSSGKVDKICMRENNRNIFVILTDGYLFQANNKQHQGNAYNYILPQTLENENSTLLCKRKGLSELEVLVLEVNPYTPKHKDKMISTLKTWLRQMEVSHCEIGETDLFTNTKPIIEDFLR